MALPASGRLRVIQRHSPLEPAEDDAAGPAAGPDVGLGHQMRWMMFIRDVQTGSPVDCSLQAVSTTMNVMVLPLDSFW